MRLDVARATALQAKNVTGADADAARVRALAAFKDFLTLWKDADPEIPSTSWRRRSTRNCSSLSPEVQLKRQNLIGCLR